MSSTAGQSTGLGTSLGRPTPGPDPGFGPDSVLRRVASEPVTGLLLARALTLEVAHPAVGQGVDDHSRFRTVPLRRLWSTLDVATRIVFGDPAMVSGAIDQVHLLHDTIHGERAAVPGEAQEVHPYSAHDPEALIWVWATLVETPLVAFERWMWPLGRTERDAFLAEMVAFGRAFGIPGDRLPTDWDGFAELWSSVVDRDVLGATGASRQAVRDVLWFRSWNVPAPVVRAARVLAIATLEDRVASRLGLGLSPRDRRLFRRIDRRLARWYRYRPDAVRLMLPAYVALRRPTIGLAGRLRDRTGRPRRLGHRRGKLDIPIVNFDGVAVDSHLWHSTPTVGP